MTNYSKTINLPKTNFSMKANLSEKETQWLEFWHKNKIYNKLKKKIKKVLSIFYTMVRLMQMVTFILVMP